MSGWRGRAAERVDGADARLRTGTGMPETPSYPCGGSRHGVHGHRFAQSYRRADLHFRRGCAPERRSLYGAARRSMGNGGQRLDYRARPVQPGHARWRAPSGLTWQASISTCRVDSTNLLNHAVFTSWNTTCEQHTVWTAHCRQSHAQPANHDKAEVLRCDTGRSSRSFVTGAASGRAADWPEQAGRRRRYFTSDCESRNWWSKPSW
jgi:hypothetical protein